MRVRGDRGLVLQQYESSVRAGLESILPERVLARFDLLKRKDARLMRLETKHSKQSGPDPPVPETKPKQSGPLKPRKCVLPLHHHSKELPKEKEQMSTKRMISKYLDRGNLGNYSSGLRQTGKNTESMYSLNRINSKPAASKTSKPILKNSKDRSFRSNKTVTFEDQQDLTEATDASKRSFLVDSSAVLR